MHVRRRGTQIEVTTPAKINLFLEILGRRPDGYHEIETLLTAITIYDTLLFEAGAAGQIELSCRWTGDPAAEEPIPVGPENLVWRAVELVRQRALIHGGAAIELIKRIPAAAGLGGASSDAAAALVAANIAWQLKWPRERLLELAKELGSDVPFFLTRGAALARGRGECLDSLPVPRLHFAVVRPPVGLSTAAVYRACALATEPVGSAELAAALSRGDAAAAAKRMANGLTPAATALTPWIKRLGDELDRQGVLGHQMSGSGSSCFAICRHARHARRVARRLRARNVGASFAATTAVAS
jgi:4-diphosphocytidyl-2-C-methyl-D-erythritol kinase